MKKIKFLFALVFLLALNTLSAQNRKDAIRVQKDLKLGLTVYLQKVQNNAEIILHEGCNEWTMLPNGGIVLKDKPEYGLTVFHQKIQNDSKIILHKGYNKWKVLSNGAIVLKTNPKFGLTVKNQSVKNNSVIILHEGYNKWKTNFASVQSNNPTVVTNNSTTKKVKASTLKAVNVSKAGKAAGSFEKIGNKKWGEFKLNKNTIHAEFEETHRGPFSVFLHDKKRNIKVILNLHTKKVSVGGNPYFDITSASDKMVLSGYSVGKVRITGNSYIKMMENEWHRTSSSGVENIYVEQSKNKNEVQLISKYGKTIRKVKIDVKNNKVTSNTSGASFSNGTFTEAIKEVKTRPSVLPATPPTKLMDGGKVGDKCYILTSVENRSKVIDIVASGRNDGTRVNLWGKKIKNNNQLFWFAPVSKYEFMMVPHHTLDKLHGGPTADSKSRSAISFSKSNPSQVSIKAGRKNNEDGNPKPNSNLSIQLFEVDNGAMNSNETHVAIKTKKGYFTVKEGKLIITEKFEGIASTFVFEKTDEQGAPLGLFSQQYAAPVPQRPLTAAQVRSINTVILEGGKLEKYKNTKTWVRKNASGKVIDVLQETSRNNGQIYLRTENTLSKAFPLSLKLTDLRITSNYLTNHNGIIVDFVKSTNSNTLSMPSGYNYLNILKFRGMVVMMYATNKETFTDGCSGGAPREKKIFRKACDSHDDNWAAPWRMAGYTDEVGQKNSDAIFLADMKDIAGNGWDREVAAGAFFRAVRSTDEGQGNFKQSRGKENSRHKMLYKPEQKVRDAFSNIIKNEYSDDVLDDVVNFIGDVKDFGSDAWDETKGFFESIF